MNLMPFIGDLGLFQVIASGRPRRPAAAVPTRAAAAPAPRLASPPAGFSPAELVIFHRERRKKEAAERLCTPEAVKEFFKGNRESAAHPEAAAPAAEEAALTPMTRRVLAQLKREREGIPYWRTWEGR